MITKLYYSVFFFNSVTENLLLTDFLVGSRLLPMFVSCSENSATYLGNKAFLQQKFPVHEALPLEISFVFLFNILRKLKNHILYVPVTQSLPEDLAVTMETHYWALR